jgi:hypothetical protein
MPATVDVGPGGGRPASLEVLVESCAEGALSLAGPA